MARSLIPVFTVRCPVGNDPLGYRAEGKPFSALCTDCQFIYSWDRRGHLLTPEKYNPKKCVTCGCGCGR